MNITSAKFIKGVVKADDILEEKKPHIAFIGRSNVGKSSIINALTKQKDLARVSSYPGRTREINIFLINKSFYLIDLPGYGFARGKGQEREKIQDLIGWYLFDSHYQQKKIVLIIDANVGPTENDLEMLHALENRQKNIVIALNKIDKIKKSEYQKKIQRIQDLTGSHKIIFCSAEKGTGLRELVKEIFEK